MAMRVSSSTCSEKSHAFWGALKERGYNFFTGVPCSFLSGLISCVSRHDFYFPAVREDAAVGLASGAWLAGKKSAVLMQNSGLGVVLNALTSLNLIYQIPVLFIISLRGYQIQDAPEHEVMGEVTTGILDLVKIPYRILDTSIMDEDLSFAEKNLTEKRIPAALLIRKGVLG